MLGVWALYLCLPCSADAADLEVGRWHGRLIFCLQAYKNQDWGLKISFVWLDAPKIKKSKKQNQNQTKA